MLIVEPGTTGVWSTRGFWSRCWDEGSWGISVSARPVGSRVELWIGAGRRAGVEGLWIACHRHACPLKPWERTSSPKARIYPEKGPLYTIRQGTKAGFFPGIDWPCVEPVAKDNDGGRFWGFRLALPLLLSCWPGWPSLHSNASLKSLRVWQNSRAILPEKLVLGNGFLSGAKGGSSISHQLRSLRIEICSLKWDCNKETQI